MMFNRFVLTDYKGSISLTSTTRSSITEIVDHSYKQYENKVINTTSFTATTEVRERMEENS